MWLFDHNVVKKLTELVSSPELGSNFSVGDLEGFKLLHMWHSSEAAQAEFVSPLPLLNPLRVILL